MGTDRVPLRSVVVRGFGQAFLSDAICPANPLNAFTGVVARIESLDQANRFTGGLRQAAKGDVLRGLVALERGDIHRAEELFGEALRVWGSPAQVARGEGLDFPGRRAAIEAMEIIRAAR
jgi:hypothetical protein